MFHLFSCTINQTESQQLLIIHWHQPPYPRGKYNTWQGETGECNYGLLVLTTTNLLKKMLPQHNVGDDNDYDDVDKTRSFLKSILASGWYWSHFILMIIITSSILPALLPWLQRRKTAINLCCFPFPSRHLTSSRLSLINNQDIFPFSVNTSVRMSMVYAQY